MTRSDLSLISFPSWGCCLGISTFHFGGCRSFVGPLTFTALNKSTSFIICNFYVKVKPFLKLAFQFGKEVHPRFKEYQFMG